MNTQNIITKALATPAKKRMSLDDVREGVIERPWRILLYGQEKIGKSSTLMSAPSPIWFGRDSGTEHLPIKRMPQPETFGDVRDGLADIRNRGRALGYRTLVIDPLGWFQPLLIASFTGGSVEVNLATWGDGRGAGYQALETVTRLMIKDIDMCWEAGLNIALLAHSTEKTFDDPEGKSFTRYSLDLEKKFAGPVKQYVDHILFTKYEIYGRVEPGSGKNGKAKAFGSGARMLYTENRPGFDAGNRASLPPSMPLHGPTFFDALARGLKQQEEHKADIEAALAEINDEAATTKVRSWLADPSVDIGAVANAVASKLAEVRAQREQPQAPQAPQTETQTQAVEENKEGQST